MMVLPAMLFCTTYLAPMVRTGAHMARAAVRMETGVAQRWNAQKGFGFIQPDDGGDDIFVHFSEILDGRMLEEGATVSFTKVFDPRKGKERAEKVTGGCEGDDAGRGSSDGSSVERRVDPSDGVAYTKAEYLDYLGYFDRLTAWLAKRSFQSAWRLQQFGHAPPSSMAWGQLHHRLCGPRQDQLCQQNLQQLRSQRPFKCPRLGGSRTSFAWSSQSPS